VPAPAVSARQVAYRSSDGTEVRMLVISGEPAGDMQAGAPGAPGGPPFPRPAILYGYGGFGISLTPAYSATILAWVEAGGVYAIAGLRGGSEEGEDWHRAGMLDRRQCVFDDFHAAAEQLGWLLSYSPYHHVTDGVEYPSVLFTVFDNDSRVDPVHARKMCAALQHATSASPGRRPILLRREADVGHSSRAVSRSVNLSADILAFLASHTGLSLAPPP
jgi:prolyl oligopeptidase PreP (S9A serine peptidase family)